MAGNLPPVHADFVARLRDVVAADARFKALLIGGSYAHGALDTHSDLDFVLVTEDEAWPDVMASRTEFAKAMDGCLAAFTGEHVGEPRLLICLYGPPLLHVDLKFVRLPDLDHSVERPALLFAREPTEIESRLDRARIMWPNRTPDWFETRAWTWLHYAAARLERGELFEAIGMLGFFREQVLGPMLYRRAGRDQRGVRRIEQRHLDPDGRLAATLAVHDEASIRSALTAAITLYLDLRSDDPPRQATPGMPDLLFAFLGVDP